jgi:hypothetical protein
MEGNFNHLTSDPRNAMRIEQQQQQQQQQHQQQLQALDARLQHNLLSNLEKQTFNGVGWQTRYSVRDRLKHVWYM